MELVDYLRMLRRQWVWVVGSVVVLTALAAVYVMTAPKTYKATSQLFVGGNVIGTTTADNSAANASSNYVLDRIETYSTFVDYAAVLQPVITEAKLSTTASDLSKQVSASVIPNTVVISVSVSDPSAAQAKTLADAVAKSLGAYIARTDVPVAGTASPVKPEVTSLATTPSAPDSPNRNLMIALGIIVGLALGLVLASLRDQLRRTRPARAQAAAPAAPEAPVATVAEESPFAPAPARAPAPADSDGASRPAAPAPGAKQPAPASLEAALASTTARSARPSREGVSVPPAENAPSER